MKLTKKAKLWLATTSTMPLVAGLLIGVATPAVAPSKAEAQMLVLKRYENTAKFQPKELVQMLQAVGFEGEALKNAWAVAMKESRGNALSYNGNRKTGDHSYGLFQINMIDNLGAERRAKLGLAYNAELLNPVVNAKAAYYMSGHGKDWSAWKGTKTQVVRYWLSKYPYKAHQQATKAKAKAKAKAVAKSQAVIRKTKAKVVAKAKPTQKQ
jgi:hypothetical protein